jgi:hypothetical protein
MSMTIHIGDALTHGYGLLRLPRMTPDEFWQFCQDNPTLQVERNAEGDFTRRAPSNSPELPGFTADLQQVFLPDTGE